MKRIFILVLAFLAINLGLQAQNCLAPTNVQATGSGPKSMRITWNYPGVSNQRIMLVNNVNIVNHPGEGYNYADISSLYGGQISLGMNATYPNLGIIDDITLTENAVLTKMTFFVFVENASPQSVPVSGLQIRIYGSQPTDSLSTPIWTSGLTTPTECTWTGAYRANSLQYSSSTYLSDTTRPVFAVTANVNTSLAAGNYWIAVSFKTNSNENVWGVPLVDDQHVSTGNAYHYDSNQHLWVPWQDAASHEQMGMPLTVYGYYSDNNLIGCNVYREGVQINTQTIETPYFDDIDTALSPLTTYCYTVKAVYTDCLSNPSDSACGMTLADPCFVSTLPYNEDFNSYGVGTQVFPNCWKYIIESPSGGTSPYITTPTTVASPSLRINAGTYESNTVITPSINPVELLMQELVVYFKAYKTSASSKLLVGVISDPTDIYSFHVLDTISPSATNTFEEYYIDLSTYNGPGNYFAFKAINGPVFIDDFSFLPIRCLHPSTIYVQEVGSDYVTVGWHGFPGTEPYTIMYKNSDNFQWTTEEYIYDTLFTITGLDVLESYSFDIKIKSTCGDNNNVISKTLTFSTTCSQAHVPFMEDFDSYYIPANVGFTVPDCWSKVNSAGTNYGFPYVYNSSTDYAFSYDRSLRFESKALGTSGQGENYAILPEMDYPINTLSVRFWGYKSVSSTNPNNNGVVIIGVTTNVVDADGVMSSFVPVDTITIVQGRNFYIANLGSYTGSGHITFKSPKIPDITNSFYIDNVEVYVTTDCRHPEHLISVGSTTNSIKVSWEPYGGTPASYTLAYKETNGYGWSEINNITDTFYNVTGLIENTNYDFKVLSHCGSGSSIYSFVETFKTECSAGIDIPYSIDFEDEIVGEIPNCWSKVYNVFEAAEIRQSTSTTNPYSFSGEKYLKLKTDYMWVSTPAINENIEDLSMTIYVRKTGSGSNIGQLMVGISSDPADTSAFEFVGYAVPTTTSTYQRFEFNFGNVTTTGFGKHIVFRIDNPAKSGEYYLDDLEIFYNTSCSTPTNLTASNITSSTATLTWTSDTAMTSCQLMYKSKYEEDWHLVTNITGSSYTINNLPISTLYQAKVSSTCGNEDSRWTDAISFTTDCGYISNFPYTESFDTYSSSTFPTCWGRGSTAAVVDGYPKISNSHAYTSPFAYYFMRRSNNYSYAILPEVDPNISINQLQITYKLYAANPSSFMVGVIDDTTDFSTFTPWDTVMTGSQEWIEYYTSFAGFTGSGQFIVLMPAYGNTFIYLDDVVLDLIPLCHKPTNVTVERLGNTWADLSWSPGQNEHQWQIAFKEPRQAAWTYVTAMDTLFHLNGLTPSTTYQYKICSTCGPDTNSAFTDVNTFTTYCDAIISLPYIENFDSYGTTSGSYPTCWIANSNGHDPDLPHITTSSYSGAGALYIKAMNYFSTMAITPKLDSTIDMRNLRVSFMLKNSPTTTLSLVFGVMENPQDWNSFVPLDTVHPQNSVSGWSEVNLYMADYNLPAGRHLAFYHPFTSSSGSTYICIDNLVINTTDCAAPQDLATTNVGSTWANVKWSHSPLVNQWEYVYGPSGFNPDDSIPILTNYDTAVISGLEGSTLYDLYVRNSCPNGMFSDWSQRFVFSTGCLPINTIPYYEDFDNYGTHPNVTHSFFPFCWSKTGTGVSQLSSLSYSYYFSSPAALAIDRSTSQYEYVCTPEINDNLSYLQITFLGKFQSTNESIDVGVMSNPMDTSTFVLVETIQSRSNVWNEFVVPFTSYTGNGHYIAFRAKNGPDLHFYLDNLLIDNAPVCVKPINPNISNIQLNSVDIDWTPGRHENTWEIAYGLEGFNPEMPTATTIISTTAHPTTITGLTPGTFYDVYVRSSCEDNTYSEWSSVVSFRTRCTAIDTVPYNESFDSYGTPPSYGYEYSDIFPTCWDRSTNSSKNNNLISWYPSISTNHQNGVGSLEFRSANNTYCIGSMPPISNNLSIDTLQINLHVKRGTSTTYDGLIQIGVMTDPFDTTTFVLVQSITPSSYNNWEEFTIPFSDYTGTGKYIAFKSRTNGNNNFFIDNITLERIPTCIEPENFEAIQATENTITLNWLDTINTSHAWEVYYGMVGFDVNYPEYTQMVTSTPCVITGLQEGVDYEFYLRAYCESDDQSFWCAPITVRTLCSTPKTLPYVETFDNYQGVPYQNNGGVVPGCWFAYRNNTTIPTPHIVNQSYNFSFPNSLMMTARGTDNTSSYVVLPEMADSLNRLSMIFWKCMYNSQDNSTLTVGYMTDNMDFNTFVAVDTILNEYDLGGAFDTISFITYPNIPPHGYIAFRFSSNYLGLDYCAIDNVIVNNEIFSDCLPPTNLTVSNIGLYTASFSWTPQGDETQWFLETKERDVEYTYFTGITAYTPSISLMNLRENTWYIARVRAVCYELWESDYADTIHFKTLSNDAIEDYTLSNSVSLYPNPTTGQITIHSAAQTIQSVAVYDVYGKLLIRAEATDNEIKLDLANYATGLYIARIQTEKGVVTKRIVRKDFGR